MKKKEFLNMNAWSCDVICICCLFKNATNDPETLWRILLVDFGFLAIMTFFMADLFLFYMYVNYNKKAQMDIFKWYLYIRRILNFSFIMGLFSWTFVVFQMSNKGITTRFSPTTSFVIYFYRGRSKQTMRTNQGTN